MQTVMYADVLVAINIYVTWFLLIATRLLCHIFSSKISTALASVLGGVSSLAVLIEMNFVFSLTVKLFVCAVIVWVAFLPKTFRLFIKTFTVYLLMNFVLAGLMLFLEYTVSPAGVIYQNGAVYFDVSVLFLAFLSLGFYGLIKLFDKLLKHRVEGVFYEMTVYFRNKEVTVHALFDTGNTLFDGMEGKIVTVVSLEAVKHLFSEEEFRFFVSPLSAEEVPQSLLGFVRFVPCGGIGGKSVLPAFVPQKIILSDSKNIYCNQCSVIAVTNEVLGDGTYCAILNSLIFERSVSL